MATYRKNAKGILEEVGDAPVIAYPYQELLNREQAQIATVAEVQKHLDACQADLDKTRALLTERSKVSATA